MPKFHIIFEIFEEKKRIELWPTFPVTINRDLQKVIQLCGCLPSTERRKWRPHTISRKSPVNL